MQTAFDDVGFVLPTYAAKFGFPTTYLVLDLETTGFSPTKDFIIDAGCTLVMNNQIVQQASLLIDWSKAEGVDCQHIQYQLARQQEQYAKAGRPHYYPWERLKREGLHPNDVLVAYIKLIYDHIVRNDSVIVGHGFYRFDRSVLDSHTSRFMNGYTLPWLDNSILDTGLIEKAIQINSPPFPEDTLDDWLDRMDRAGSKVKWNLSGHCVPKYNLAARYNIDTRLMHTAACDCTTIHNLLDTYRQLAEILNGQRQTLSP